MTANDLAVIVRVVSPLLKDHAERITTIGDGAHERILVLERDVAGARQELADLKASMEAVIEAAITKAMAAIPMPKDGQDGKDGWDGAPGVSVTIEEVAPLVEQAVQKAIGSLPVPKDGVGVTGALIDHEGSLVLTLSDGTTKALGRVKGTDGRDVDHGEVMKFLLGEIAKVPKPQDGKDGKDGVGFDELEFVEDETGRSIAKFIKGAETKYVRLPGFIDRGVWRPDTAYAKGDGVTFGGSFFIAQTDTPAGKPEETTDWRLAVKRGREGKPGPKGIDGKDGKPGTRDATW